MQLTANRTVNSPNKWYWHTGPFDIIGDIHGCVDEMYELRWKLHTMAPGQRRTFVFLGDYVDRGPWPSTVLWQVHALCQQSGAIALCGNHDDKLYRTLVGNRTKITPELEQTLLSVQDSGAWRVASDWLGTLNTHYVLDYGRLVVAHAGITIDRIGRESKGTFEFCKVGESDGTLDDDGYPKRTYQWREEFQRQGPLVVYGHTPTTAPGQRYGYTINLDGGCVFGGKLAALRYPEMEIVTVDAQKEYSRRPARAWLAL